MLNFRNTNIFFIGITILLIILHIIYGLSAYIFIGLFCVYSLIVFYGCTYIGSNFFIKIICSAQTHKKEIAISFDDGPVKNYTPEILNLLKQADVKAIFFCIGMRVSDNEKILNQIKDEGHIIGNHSYSHDFWFDLFSSNRMENELRNTDEEIKRVTGLQPKLFRPPYGVTNPNLKKAITRGNYTPVGWSVRSMDTVITDENKLLKKIKSALKPGAVFLFHDTSKTTLNILPEFIQEVKNRGYAIIRLDKLLHLKPYA